MLGTVLGDRYRLVDWLGGGSMGEVWLAEDEVLGRRVAVKVVKPALLDEDGFAERFHAEARVMAQLRHPGIVAVYDYGRCAADGPRSVGYLVMELIDGEPLSAVLERRGALPVAETLRMALQVLEALEAAHASGVVHRDIKPANLMVRDDRTVIADFGIARPACDARLTVPGMVLGTAAYQAPEQASTGEVTASADLYALGVVLYECLAGRLPFDGETALEVILKHLTEPVPPLPGEVPAPVWALVERAMAKEPGGRWPGAAAMAVAVRDALAQLGEEAPPAPTLAPAPVRARPVAARVPWAGLRLRGLVGVTLLTLLCVVGAAGATVIRPDQDGTPGGAQGDTAAAGPTARADLAGPVVPAPVEAASLPLAAQQPTSAPLTEHPAVPEAGMSPTPGFRPEPAPGRTSAEPVLPPSAPAPAPSVPAAGQNPVTPAPPPPVVPTPSAPRETATPSAPATPTKPVPPTKQPTPQLPSVVRITNGGVALDNSHSADLDGNPVGTWETNGTSAQMWGLEKIDGERYFLRNASSNFSKVLDLDLKSGGIQIWSNPPGAENQLWTFVPVLGGYRIVNAYTKGCLTSDEAAHLARAVACTASENQVWAVG